MNKKNEFLIISKKTANQAAVTDIKNNLEKYNIPYKETDEGIVVLISEEEFKQDLNFFYPNNLKKL